MPAPSSTPTSSTATSPPAASTAARTASAQGVSTAMRAGTPQAASAAASNAVPTGPSVSGAATSPRGTKKPVIRPTLRRPGQRLGRRRKFARACVDQFLGLAPDIAADQRLDGGMRRTTHFSLATYTPVQSGGESSIRPSTRSRIMS